MQKYIVMTVLALLLFGGLVRPAAAQTPVPLPGQGRDPVFEQQVLDKLGKLNPEAVPYFKTATAALDADDYATARTNYEQVLQLVPNFPDALRRLSYVESAAGNTDKAIGYARQAYALDPSPYNKIGLAQVLTATDDPAYSEEALTLAKEAVAALPDDPSANMALLQAAANANDSGQIEVAIRKLQVVAADSPATHYFAGLLEGQYGNWETAESELLLSQKLGMPANMVQQTLSETGISAQASQQRLLHWSEYGFVAWLVGLPLLLVVGAGLSQLTLVTVKRPQSAKLEVPLPERLIRGLYGLVITLTSIYFYVSIPIIFLVVLGLGGGILYLFFAIGRIPIQLLAIVVVATLYTLAALVRSVFTRVPDEEPGRLLTRADAPRLWAMAEEVAAKVGTRPVDAIYLTPGTDISVLERGNFFKKLLKKGQRCLVLGLGVLPDFSQAEFRAVLAHEYGHFSNHDTAGGQIARQVRATVYRMAFNLARTGQAHWFNPAWLFINGFHRIFLRITLGASRLQEILADRYAAIAYGAQNFKGGLTHVIRQGLIFEMQAGHEINLAVNERRVSYNVYNQPPWDPQVAEEKIGAKLTELLNRPTTPYDSHPAPKERFALVEALNLPNPPETMPALVLELFVDPEALQTEMTAKIYKNIRERNQRRK